MIQNVAYTLKLWNKHIFKMLATCHLVSRNMLTADSRCRIVWIRLQVVAPYDHIACWTVVLVPRACKRSRTWKRWGVSPLSCPFHLSGQFCFICRWFGHFSRFGTAVCSK